MRTRLVSTILTAAVVILLAGLGAAPSFAASIDTPFTITPGGSFTAASSSSVLLKDTTTTNTIKCTTSTATGYFTPGHSPSGAGIGKIKTIFFSGCKAATINVTVTANAANPPVWPISLSAYSAPTSTGKITGIHLTVSSAGCNLVIDGTSGTADNGHVPMTYTNPPAKTLATPGTGTGLHVYSAACVGLFNNTDVMTMTSSYTLSPAQHIT